MGKNNYFPAVQNNRRR